MENKTLVANLRKQKGWTQERLAEKAGLSVRTIQRIERGDDSSLETLGLVANALDVSIKELFQADEPSPKMEEVAAYSDEQASQLEKRKAEDKLFSIYRLAYVFIMVGLAAGIDLIKGELLQTVVGLIWVFTFLAGLKITKYIRKTHWKTHLDKKYPLTKNVPLSRDRLDHKSSSNSSKDDFLWWKNPVARPIGLTFWGVIVPALFICKYALHLF
ncbi:MAG: helix-turn-helix domain-containing protein [Streptococcus sobrinus]|uniref:helix-turn-helix domain-containing protein n=2 Tax=Streptococcus sobrinus TaxID=1310 RepID=UPI00030CC859|nr:helix-turn-helix transcriptional regulator [Streptococcus sobrinus]